MQVQRKLPDFFLLTIALLLTGFGLVAVYSASFAIGYENYHNANFFFVKQLMWATLGIGVLFFTMNIPYNFFRKLSPLMFLGVFVLLVLLIIPGVGIERNYATRWIGIGPLVVQPSEVLKVVICLYFPYLITKKIDVLDDFKKGVMPIIVLMGVCFLLIMVQPDFSTAAMIAFLTVALLFAAGVRIKHLFGVALAGVPFLLLMAIFKPYRVKRLFTFFNPEQADQLKEGYQIMHSLYAFANGGITGVGFGAGLQKLFYLPEPHTDFIFAIIGEELGLIGTIAIIILFALFFWRGLFIASRSEELYAKLAAIGITVMISFQAFVNMGITVGLLPVTGMTLPFISYGGSSLLITLFATGILLNISRYINRN
ncbi:cell division protein FtsW [Desulfuribacillus stibiiarsenatis]|uniref:Probable peptidoglycan glycosyltransferase FtsW n=1 Tax=Desulfuribacillus stibiiarsenatis TaxID=1390249 RepID=A0A1E5L5S1_9FIRM|nr:putative lipid II flippase FtsW [Desulfuribacillus stibiiarsenatis]OEH85414.1 cell division protein FtsW [Desulfuribacillus stibiiarsenatis]